jgi:hypothetical protein
MSYETSRTVTPQKESVEEEMSSKVKVEKTGRKGKSDKIQELPTTSKHKKVVKDKPTKRNTNMSEKRDTVIPTDRNKNDSDNESVDSSENSSLEDSDEEDGKVPTHQLSDLITNSNEKLEIQSVLQSEVVNKVEEQQVISTSTEAVVVASAEVVSLENVASTGSCDEAVNSNVTYNQSCV